MFYFKVPNFLFWYNIYRLPENSLEPKTQADSTESSPGFIPLWATQRGLTLAKLCSLLLTLKTHTQLVGWGQAEPERRDWQPIVQSCLFSLLTGPWFALRWPLRSMGLQSWPPAVPPLSSMACLQVETPSICRGKFKSGNSSLNSHKVWCFVFLYFKIWYYYCLRFLMMT